MVEQRAAAASAAASAREQRHTLIEHVRDAVTRCSSLFDQEQKAGNKAFAANHLKRVLELTAHLQELATVDLNATAAEDGAEEQSNALLTELKALLDKERRWHQLRKEVDSGNAEVGLQRKLAESKKQAALTVAKEAQQARSRVEADVSRLLRQAEEESRASAQLDNDIKTMLAQVRQART
jgi:hypothetical protein